MADIFISYSSEDRERVIPVVRALEAHGWSVWWDRIIPPGKTFSRVIEEALGAARSLIVLWTATSIKSDWVSNEAAEGARKKILIPALLDEVEIPFEFKRIQAANLIDWRGGTDHAGYQQLIKALTDLLGPPAAKGPLPAAPKTIAAEPVPGEIPADTVEHSQLKPSGQKPILTKAHAKTSKVRIIGWMAMALAMLVVAGVAILFKTELFQPHRVPSDDSASKPGIEVAAQPAKPEPPDAARSAAGESVEESPPVEKEIPALSIQPEPGKPSLVLSEDATPEAPINAAESASAMAKAAQPKTAPPAVKEPKIDVPTPVPKTPPPQAKPRQQNQPRPAAREAGTAQPAPDYIAPAPQIKSEEPPTAAKPRNESPRKKVTNSIGMEFVLIPASPAAFTMGSRLAIEELRRRFGGSEAMYKPEKPAHAVKIEQPFYLQTTPVTQGQWRRVMGDQPSSFQGCGEDCPVEMVSWDDARRFINRLNQMESHAGYRLPSEAEWEYAARAGSEAEFFFGSDAAKLGEFAWYSANSENRPHAVAQRNPNAWGLYDMTGNVWEWVEDDWHAAYDGAPADGSAWTGTPRGAARVVRGGGWGVTARYCRSSTRYYGNPAARTSHVGFRLARSVSPGS